MAADIMLFLVCLTVASVAIGKPDIQCSQPNAIEHGITNWDGRSNIAKYACFQGFHLVGPPSVECRYGKWYSDDKASYPTCKPIVCNSPNIENGQLETGDSVRYRSGQQANVECKDGFELRSGVGKIVCKEDGSWQADTPSADFPTCKEKPCQDPKDVIPQIQNGSREVNGPRQGSPGGGGSYKPGSVVMYYCDPGFVLLPFSADRRICRKGIWEGITPACVSPETRPVARRSHCPSPAAIENGYYLTDKQSETPLALPVSERGKQYERGTIARYHCHDGHTIRTLHGQDTYRCMASGDWYPTVPPVCIKLEQNTFHDPLDEVMCQSPSPIPHTDFERMEGWLTSNGAIHGTVLEYTCRIGYRDSRTPCLPIRRTCHAGKWVGNLPSCVPFDYCERPPSISHGFMVTSPESVYRILTEVRYECHPGYRMKDTSSLKCHATGCWMPNELPQCIREDMFESGWSDADTSSLPLVISLVTVSTGFAVIALFTTSCLVVLCRRKGGPVPPPSGPAHWSTTVTVTPECRPRTGESAAGAHVVRRQEQDRMALIAFADGMQRVTLPSYEEALREGNVNAANSHPNGINGRHGHGMSGSNNANGGGDVVDYEDISSSQPNGGRQHHSSRIYGSNGLVMTSSAALCTNPHMRQHGRYRHNGSVMTVSTSRSKSRHGQGHNDSANEGGEIQHWSGRPSHGNRSSSNGRRAGSTSGSSGGSPRDHDALSDTISHGESVSSGGVVNNWSTSRQPGTASLRSGSAASVEVSGTNVLSKNPSENTLTTTTTATTTDNTSSSQTPSCRALAGSLASFDTSSIVNTEGVPLLEENELETEGSNSSEPGDTGSATYSEGSSAKN